VHNIIGGWMADMSSPTDPIFYLHHGNVDRLWDAWCSEPKKIVPSQSSSYWSGSFTYATNLSIAKSQCYRPAILNYQYAQPNNVPSALPLNAQEARIIRVQAQPAPILVRPAIGNFANAAGRTISGSRRSLGGVANMTLNETSVSARLPLQASDISSLKDVLSAASGAMAGSQASTATLQYPYLVLDKLAVTALGKQGGYYYNIYLNLPAAGNADAARQAHFVGTFGAFEASEANHHGGGTLRLPLSDVLQNLGVENLNEAVISLVRVNGPNSPKGAALSVGEMRVELSTDRP
jgi:tyrosinase